MKHILAVLVENRPGVLSKTAGLFSRRGFNIDSLAVGVTQDPGISRMTIVVDGDEYVVEQVAKQLNKLIEVIKVWNIAGDSAVMELMLLKVNASQQNRGDIIDIMNLLDARVIFADKTTVTMEITGEIRKLAAAEEMLRPYGILEMVRTGAIAVEHGRKAGREWEASGNGGETENG